MGNIKAKGSFKNDLKDGVWTERYTNKDFHGQEYYLYEKGNYVTGKREGKWIQYVNDNHVLLSLN